MTGYVCKYTPNLIIESFGDRTLRIEPEVSSCEIADGLTHPNMCSYARLVLEECLGKHIDKIVLMNCCDAIRRLYDILKAEPSVKFIHIVDLPRKRDVIDRIRFKNEIIRLIESYQKSFDVNFSAEALRNLLNSSVSTTKKEYGDINIAIIGGRSRRSLEKMIEEFGGNVIYNLTCTGTVPPFRPVGSLFDPVEAYADILLDSYPCMRMDNTDERLDIIEEDKRIDGVIYHTVKFCDLYSYEYAMIRDRIRVPILKLETDYTDNSEGQVRTRVQAFIESLKRDSNKRMVTVTGRKDIVIGIDSGSTSTSAVIIDSNKSILGYSIVPTGAKSIESAEKALEIALKSAGISKDDASLIVATGYGRVSIPFANLEVTEITCHARGAFFLDNSVRTIIDIGGQDSKVIRIDENGNVIDFIMNDKCSAGTGRFLENMSRVLDIPVDRMGEESLKWKEDIEISSMCTVFAESEVITLIAKNKEKSDIIHALNKSITRRVASLIEKVGGVKNYMMTGGVAKNTGVVRCLEEKLGEKITVPKEPQIVGSLGAALSGLEKLSDKIDF